MNCNELNNNLDDYIDGVLPAEQYESLEMHIQNCVQCHQVVKDENNLRKLLRQLPVAMPAAEFLDTALKNAVVKDNRHAQGFIKGFGSAIAASLALWLVVSLMPVSESTHVKPDNTMVSNPTVSNTMASETASKAPVGLVAIQLHEEREIKLSFHSNEALSGAKITLQIPENIHLLGYQNERSLQWQVDLVKGANMLNLPIKAFRVDQGQLVAKIEHNHQVKILRIDVLVEAQEIIQLKLDFNAYG